ncbi:MAG TPA: tetratricopeptide repeat protein, partial [Azonexus sp.]|nr:tetratricopeptide repeat protein [Azonexus sp.]
MSLLMDALKRAEASKEAAARVAGQDATPRSAADGLSLEPLLVAAPGGSSLPELAAHIDALDADLAATALPPPARRPPPESLQPGLSTPNPASNRPESEKINLAAARNAFAAKQPQRPSRLRMVLALGLIGVALVGIGAYVWYQIQSMSGTSLTLPASTPAPVAQRPAAPTSAPAALPALPALPLANSAPISPSTATAPVAAARPAFSSRAETIEAMAASGKGNNAPQIRLTRSHPEPDANVEAGYASLQGNQFDAARRDYERALKADPNNVDALLALAAIAQRQGRSADADRYRQRAIDADPRDPAAQAASLGSSASGDQLANESRLKSLLAAQPESGPLNFALGNLYSRQSRWSEAQQVYFNAVAADADNPDYLFNLA